MVHRRKILRRILPSINNAIMSHALSRRQVTRRKLSRTRRMDRQNRLPQLFLTPHSQNHVHKTSLPNSFKLTANCKILSFTEKKSSVQIHACQIFSIAVYVRKKKKKRKKKRRVMFLIAPSEKIFHRCLARRSRNHLLDQIQTHHAAASLGKSSSAEQGISNRPQNRP